MAEGTVLRVFVFRPRGPEFDGALRDRALPDLLHTPGVVDAYVGRRGSGEVGERVLASVWESRQQMIAALGDSSEIEGLPGRGEDGADASADGWLEVLRLAVAVAPQHPDRRDSPTILRIFHGRVRDGELDEYLQEARTGTLADASDNQGLISLYLGAEPPSRFVTVSAWTGWPAIEQATGGNLQQPLTVRNAARIVEFEVAHYEILPNSARPEA